MSARNKPPPGKKRNGHDPNQTEFGIIWQLWEYPFRLRAEAARLFRLGERTVYRYLAAAKTNTLAPKTRWGHWRKLDPAKLQAHVRHQPDATLQELQRVFGISHCFEFGRRSRIRALLENLREDITRLILKHAI
jgi:hypothetical protein